MSGTEMPWSVPWSCTVPRLVEMVVTCCGGRTVSVYHLSLDDEDARITFSGDRSFVVESADGHDGVHYQGAGSKALAVPDPAGPTKLHIECPRCHLDMQFIEETLTRLLRQLRDAYRTGDGPRVLRIPAQRLAGL